MIQFAAGSATIAEASKPTIDRLAAALRGCPDAAFEVGGHTDSQGSDTGNQRLSEGRARAVLAALRTDDLPLLAMTARGYGESEPAADNETEEGRAQNRRIAFTLPGLAAAAAEGAAGAGDASEPEGETSLVAQGQSGDPAEVCLARLDAILSENTIEFAAGSAEITPESAPIVNAIAGVLRGCPEAALEVGGHTDSSGSESGNLALSQSRAEAVLAAVRRKDLPLQVLTVRGYGETDPIADNGSADGRAANRRIAFEAAGMDEGEGAEGDGQE